MGSELFNIHSEKPLWRFLNREGMLSRKPSSALFKRDKSQIWLENTTAKLLLHEGQVAMSYDTWNLQRLQPNPKPWLAKGCIANWRWREALPTMVVMSSKMRIDMAQFGWTESRCRRWKTWLVSWPCFCECIYTIYQIQWQIRIRKYLMLLLPSRCSQTLWNDPC